MKKSITERIDPNLNGDYWEPCDDPEEVALRMAVEKALEAARDKPRRTASDQMGET